MTAVAVAAGLVAVVVAARLAALYLQQDRLVFRPAGAVGRTPELIGLDHTELRLPADDGGSVGSWWVPGPRTDRVVIYCHGSEGHLSRELPTIRFLHDLGVGVLAVEYPGYDAAGGRPSEAGCYAAAEAAWRRLTDHDGFAPEQVVVFGYSLGAAVATHLAARHRCGGLVLHSAFTSVPDMAARAYPHLPARWFCRTKMDNRLALARCDGPVLLVHSRDDEHIPFGDARELHRLAPSPKRLVTLGGHHRPDGWQRDADVREAWQELLGADTRAWDREEASRA